MFTNERNYLKSQLGRNYYLNLLYTLKRKNRKLIIKKGSDLCVEGYPRSANTFAVLLIEQCSKKSLKIAHHMHASSQVIKSIQYDIPTVLLIRNPLDAIISNVLRERGLKITVAMKWYLDFYSDCLRYKDRLIVWDFDGLTKEPVNYLKKIEFFDFDETLYDKEKIFNRIDELDRAFKKTEDFDLINTRPNEKKKDSKNLIRSKILSSKKYCNYLQEADDLYQQFVPQGI